MNIERRPEYYHKKGENPHLIHYIPNGRPEIHIDVFDYIQDRIERRLRQGELVYPTEDTVKLSEAEGIGPKILVDRRNLYGTQLARENNRRGSTLKVIAEFEKDPDYLYSNPALVCFEPLVNGSAKLIVVDGHHRIRNSSRVLEVDVSGHAKPRYPKIPVRVFTFSQYVELLNRSNPDQHLNTGESLYNEKTFKDEVLFRASEAEREMLRFTKNDAMPKPIPNVGSIEELVERASQ